MYSEFDPATHKYEFILDPNERGISVSWEKDQDEGELLLEAEYLVIR